MVLHVSISLTSTTTGRIDRLGNGGGCVQRIRSGGSSGRCGAFAGRLGEPRKARGKFRSGAVSASTWAVNSGFFLFFILFLFAHPPGAS
eukprot:1440073-Pyramimonas_sp.AAC.1